MATAESVKAKIQSLINAANAKTGNSDTDLTAATCTLIGGYGQGGGIIDVDELPTENIIEGAVYRVKGDGVDLYVLSADGGWYFTDVAAQEGGTVQYHVVDELPEVLEPTDEATLTIHVYILKDTGLAYFDQGNGAELVVGDESFSKGWATQEEIEDLDPTDETNYGIYAVTRGSEELYIYSNGSWNMLNGIITVEDLSTARLNPNAIYRVPKTGAEMYYIYNDADGHHVISFFYLIVIFGGFGGQAIEKMYYLVVDELPEADSALETAGKVVFVYILKSTGEPYVFSDGSFISGLPEENPEFHGWVDHKPTEVDDTGYYTVRKTEYDYYLPKQGGFIKIAPVVETRDFQEAEIYKPYAQLIGRTVTDLNINCYKYGVGAYAFAGCGSLQTVIINSQCNKIGEYAFLNCTSLKSVKIMHDAGILGSEIHISGTAFAGCAELKDIYVYWEPESEDPPNEDYKYATPASEWLPENATIHYKYRE